MEFQSAGVHLICLKHTNRINFRARPPAKLVLAMQAAASGFIPSVSAALETRKIHHQQQQKNKKYKKSCEIIKDTWKVYECDTSVERGLASIYIHIKVGEVPWVYSIWVVSIFSRVCFLLKRLKGGGRRRKCFLLLKANPPGEDLLLLLSLFFLLFFL